MTLPVAILAGGRATRLGTVAAAVPKSLVDVAGRPFLARQLDYVRAQGVSSVVLCVGHLGEQIEAVVGDGSAFGLAVRYSWDGPQLLGTGGALKRALPLLGDAFFVFYGDSYLPIAFDGVEAAFRRSGRPALVTILRNRDRWDKSNVRFRDGVIVEYNKRQPTPDMAYIDYGLGVLDASVFSDTAKDEPFDLGDLYHELSVTGRLAAYEVFERFYEIGSHSGLQEAIAFFQDSEGR